MHPDEALYTELLDYLARRPWAEVNQLIVRLAQSRRAEHAIETPKTVTASGNKED